MENISNNLPPRTCLDNPSTTFHHKLLTLPSLFLTREALFLLQSDWRGAKPTERSIDTVLALWGHPLYGQWANAMAVVMALT